MSRFLSSRFEMLEAYTPGEQPQDKTYIKLNTNESPFPPSPEVIERVNVEEVRQLNLYPDPEGKALKEKLAERYGVKAENVFLSNGSDEILNFSFMAFCDKARGVIFPEITYGFYSIYANLYEIPYRRIPLRDDFSIRHTDYCDNNSMVVIANPNAPTTIALKLDEIEDILKANPDQLVLIDEAYVDFGCESAVALIERYDNLLVSMTFSKSRSMAGARLGFAFGNVAIIRDLEKIKFSTNPYNINRLTMAAGEAAIDSDAYYFENVKKIIGTREWVAAELEKLRFTVLPSKTNFVFAAHESMEGEVLYEKLKRDGVLVRHFNKSKIERFLRITIGTDEEMHEFLRRLEKILLEG